MSARVGQAGRAGQAGQAGRTSGDLLRVVQPDRVHPQGGNVWPFDPPDLPDLPDLRERSERP